LKTEILAPIKIIANASKAIASEGAVQPDLLYMRAVLVSTGQNKNDDVFMPNEMWAARHTPPLKPVNWEHESGKEVDGTSAKVVVENNQIIGCIYDCFVAEKNGNRIDDKAMASIPSNFDIVIDSVIYKYLFPRTAAKIVEGVSKDTLFVSMEAWFSNYDYLVGNKVVARNQETAFLDRHLRANGGDGHFSGEKVGRVLRNIVFGGVGIVHKPANADSVIQSLTNAGEKEEIVEPKEPEKVISKYTMGELELSETRFHNTEVDKAMAEDKVETPVTPAKAEELLVVMERLVKAQHDAELKTKSLEESVAKAAELEKTIESLKAAFAKGADAFKDTLGEESVGKLQGVAPAEWFTVLSTIVGEKLASAKELGTKLAEANDKLAKIEAATKMAARLAKIEAELGLAPAADDTPEHAQAKVAQRDKLAKSAEGLGDTEFDAWLANTKELLAVAAFKPFWKKEDKKEDEKPEDEKKKKEKAAETELAVLDNVTASESVPAGNTTNNGFDWNKAMSNLVSELFGIKEEN
jgi:hypothetical protein